MCRLRFNLAPYSKTTRIRPAGDMRVPTYKLAVVHRCRASVGIIVLTHHRLIVCLFGVSVFGIGNSCADGLSVGANFRVWFNDVFGANFALVFNVLES